MADAAVLRVAAYPKWFVPVVVVLVLVGGGGGWLGYNAINSVESNQVFARAGIGIALACAAALAFLFLRTREETVVDNDGVERVRGGKSIRIRWSEAHSFYHVAFDHVGAPVVGKATIQTADGRRIHLTEVIRSDNSVARVPALVEQYSTKVVWPSVETKLKNGEEVAFGPIRVTQSSVRIGEKSYSRDQALSVRVVAGELQVGVEGNWQPTGTHAIDIANYPTFLRAIGQVTRARAPV